MQSAQSAHYEQAADTLTGDQRERALRAAQNALDPLSDAYMTDFKRIQQKLIELLV